MKEYYDTYIDPNVFHKCMFCDNERSFKKGKYLSTCCSEECIKKLIESVNMEKYGCKNVAQNASVRAKISTVLRKKYNTPDDKISFWKLDKTSTEYAEINNAIIKKRTHTILTKYNVENISQVSDIKAKKKEYSILKYGTICPLLNIEVKKKTRETNLFKFGCLVPTKSKIVQEKTKKTNLQKYGVEHPSQNNIIFNKGIANRKEKNGGFLSAPEQKFAEMLKNRNFDYKYNYFINTKHFDFAIFDNDTLKILIEIDGEYHHAMLSDPDGVLVRDNNDEARFSLVPDNVKYINIDSKNIDLGIKELLLIYDIDYEDWILQLINNLPKEFPYPNYTHKRLLLDWKHLCTYDIYNKGQNLCRSIITMYHKSIYASHSGNKPSPIEAWNDKSLLDKCVKNRFIYGNTLSHKEIVHGFNVCKIAPKVSVFSASFAKYLIKTYLSEFDTIFDPFSGFSGRMLGACSLGKKYIGQDINNTVINESTQIKELLNLNAELVCQNVTESTGSYDCLFTCSPYNVKETWSMPIENKSCDDWIDLCLNNFNCKKYLFVVDDTIKYKNNIVYYINNKNHFYKNNEYVILIDKSI